MKLIGDMHLTINVSERFPFQPKRRKKSAPRPEPKITEKQLYDRAVDRLINVHSDYYRLLTEWKEKYAPVSFADEFHPLFIEAIYNMSYVEYLLDTLSGKSEEERDQIIIEKAKGLEDLEKRIKRYRSRSTKATRQGQELYTTGGASTAGSPGAIGAWGTAGSAGIRGFLRESREKSTIVS